MNRVEQGQRNANPEERHMFQGLVSWANNCIRFRHNATPPTGIPNPSYNPNDSSVV